MSWEEVRTKGVACPCGQGKIEQREYMDDWNQIEYSTPTIVCPICSKKYKVCTEHHDSYKPGRGSWNNYYLIIQNIPAHRKLRFTRERLCHLLKRLLRIIHWGN